MTIQGEETACLSASDARQHMMIPGMMGFKSAHTMINKERVLRGRARLKRSAILDWLCQLHVRDLAAQNRLTHSAETAEALRDMVNSEHAGENIQRGPSVEAMHKETMRAGRSAYRNIVGKKFREFGIATAMGSDGRLYMVQLFRGRVLNEEAELLSEHKITKNHGAPESTEAPTDHVSTMLDDGLDFPAMLLGLSESSATMSSEETGRSQAGHGLGVTGDDEPSSSTGDDEPSSYSYDESSSTSPEETTTRFTRSFVSI